MSYIGNTPYQVAFLTDTFSGNNSTTAFTMSVAPANTSSVLVAVSGVLQDPSTYSVSGTTLTFSAAPPTGTGNISARYLGIPASGVTTTAYRTVTEFTATAGQTTFTPPSYTVGFINVYRNGVRLGSTDYTATNGTTVVLTGSAVAGDLVTVESFLVSSVLNAIPNTVGAVQQTNIGTITTLNTPSSNTATFPAATGTVMVSGNMPAFSAYNNTTQSLSSSAYTKLAINTLDATFPNTGYDNNTNYRFTPTVAGYYQVNGAMAMGTASNNCQVTIYKNGSIIKGGNESGSASASAYAVSVNALVYLNGSTDYIELYGYQGSGGSLNTSAGQSNTYFQACMVRSA